MLSWKTNFVSCIDHCQWQSSIIENVIVLLNLLFYSVLFYVCLSSCSLLLKGHLTNFTCHESAQNVVVMPTKPLFFLYVAPFLWLTGCRLVNKGYNKISITLEYHSNMFFDAVSILKTSCIVVLIV